MDRDYIINLILKARDDVAGTIAKVSAEVEALKKTASNSGLKDLDKDVNKVSDSIRTRLHSELDRLRGDLNRTGSDADKFNRKFESLGKTIDDSSKKLKALDVDEVGKKLRRAEADADRAKSGLDRLGRQTQKNSKEWDRLSGELDKANTRIEQHSGVLRVAEKELSNLDRATDDLNKTQAQHAKSLERTHAAYDKQIEKLAQLRKARDDISKDPSRSKLFDFEGFDREIDKQRRKAEEFAAEIEALSRAKIKINADLDIGGFNSKAAQMEAEKAGLGKDIHIDVDLDAAAATAKLAMLDAAKRRVQSGGSGGGGGFFDWVRSVGEEAEQSKSSIAAFDNALRGMIVLAVIATAQQLLTIVTALGAQLVAVASSAIMAGSALGGALTTGAAQAMPVIGLLVASFARLSAVINLVKQHQLAQQQEATGAAKSAGTEANAHDAVVNALEGVISAKQQLLLAEQGLTKARFQANRQLKDMIFTEREAELAAKGAALSQYEAQANLQKLIREGAVGEIAGAQLQVVSSKVGTQKARLDANRAGQDRRFQERGSVLRPDTSVEDATHNVENASKAVDAAKRSLDQARRSANEAGADTASASGKFDYMLGQLSKAEQRLYSGVERLYNTYKRVFRPITDIIVNSMTFAVNRITGMLNNKQFIGAFESLANDMAGSFKRITSLFTSPRWVQFFSTMTKEAGKNIGPLTDAFISLAEAFRKISMAARPILKDLVGWIKQGAEAFEEWVGGGKDLREFFREGEKHLEAWGALAGAILKLFGALIGTSAKEGLSSVESLTGEINKATSYIEKHEKQVEHFFNETGRVMSAIGEVLLALGAEIIKSFNPESVEALADIIVRILIPALGESLRLFGGIIIVLDKLTQNDVVGTVLKMAVGFAIAKKVIEPFVRMFQLLAIQIQTVARLVGGFAARLVGASTAEIAAAGPLTALADALGVTVFTLLAVPAAIAAAVAAFVFLSDKFGVLDDQVDAVKDAFMGFVQPIKKPVQEFIKSIEELLQALGILGGKGTGLGKILEFVFVGIVKTQIIPAIKILGAQLAFVGELIGGTFKVAGGAIEILTGILTLNFDKIISGAKKMADGFTTPFRAMFKLALRIVNLGIDQLQTVFGGLIRWMIRRGDSLLDGIVDGFKAVYKFFSRVGPRIFDLISGGFSAVFNWVKGLRSKFSHWGSELVDAFVDAFKGIGGKVVDAISAGAVSTANFASKFGKAVAKLIDEALPNSIDMPSPVPNIDLPNNPLKDIGLYRAGGPIGRGFGGGDRVPILAEEGEHMVTKEEVRNAGGHGALFALRRALGGGLQARGGKMAEGGAVEGQKQSGNLAEEWGQFGLEALVSMIESFGGKAVAAWDMLWDSIQKRTAVGSNQASDRFDDLEKSIISSSKRISNQVTASFDRMVESVKGNIGELTHAVYQGMSYISEITTKALEAFGVKKVDLNVAKPKGMGGGKGGKGKAGGGFIGRQGERGGDTEPTWLGRGEAVLNWAHQRVVEPAMRWYHGFGLNEMFDRVGGQHAAGGFAGFAGGRPGMSTADIFDGHPSNVASSLRKLIEIMKGKWPGLGVSSTTDHSLMTTSGNVSDHSTGHAVDLAGSLPYMLRAAAWVKSSGLFKQLKQGIHNPNLAVNEGEFVDGPGFFQGAWAEHIDHIHLAVFDALRGAFGGGLTKVPKLKVGGTEGPLKELVEASLGKVTKAANKFIQEKTSAMFGVHGPNIQFGGKLPSNLEKYNHVFGEHNSADGDWGGQKMPFNDIAELAEWAGLPGVTFAQITKGESGQRPGATGEDPGGTKGLGLWMITTGFNDELIRRLGGQKAMLNPIINAKAAKEIYDSSGLGAWYGTGFVTSPNAHYRGSYAAGGPIGGDGGDGSKVPIWAHLGEWILNQRQQHGLARLLGTSVDKLKAMLGFSGGPTSFAGGGEPQKGPEIGVGRGKQISASPLPNLENYAKAVQFYIEQVNKELKRGRQGVDKKRKNLTDFLSKLFPRIAGDLEQFKDGFEVLGTRMKITLAKAAVALRKGRVVGRQLQPDQLVNLEMNQIEKEIKFLMSQRGPIVHSLNLAKKALRKAKHEHNTKAEQAAQAAINNFRDMKRENELAIAEAQQEMLEKMEQQMAEDVQHINEEAERRTGRLQTAASIASAMGFSGTANNLTQQQVPIWQEQKGQLEGQLNRARAANNQELARQIEGEINSLEVSIAEAAAAMIQNAEAAIEKAAAQGKFQVELRNRMSDVREKFGNVPQVQQERGGTLQQERGVISRELSETQALLSKAMSEGFGPDVIDPLREKTEDLAMQMEENTGALYSNTVAVRQAFIDQITNRQGFMGGIFSTLETIVTGLGNLSGIINQSRIVELLQAAGAQLAGTGTGLRGQLVSAVNTDWSKYLPPTLRDAIKALAGLHGEELVTAVKSLDFNAIINALGPESEMAKQFEAMISAILENEAAVIQNTEQIKAAMQMEEIQSFTTTAWQWFRQAIFNGMGGLLPQYAEGTPFFAKAASGAEVASTGLIEVHKGEIIVPPDFSMMLRRLLGAGSLASGLSGGSIPGIPAGMPLASSSIDAAQAMAAGAIPGLSTPAELARLRKAMEDRAQEINVYTGNDEPTDDATYLANRIGFAVRTPST